MRSPASPIPEQKRKIIGRLFVEVFQRESADKLPDGEVARRRARSIRTSSNRPAAKTKKAHTIKSHHNVGGLPETLHLKLLEPLRELFKDEVRELGLALGLPREMVYRHPFPGPGLGVRILGEVKREYADLLRARRRDLHRRAARRHGLVRQDRAGVRGVPAGALGRRDGRRPHLRECRRAARRADDRLHDGALGAAAATNCSAKVSSRIINEVRGINRVVYDIRASRRRRSSGNKRSLEDPGMSCRSTALRIATR